MSACRRTSILFFGTMFILLLCILPISSAALSADSGGLVSPKAEITATRFGLSLKWEDVPDAKCYRIYRSEKDGPLLLDETTAHIWVDTETPSKEILRYAVTSVDKNGNESEPCWQYTCYLAKPKPRATEVLAGFCIKWDKVEGAREYEVARKSGNGDFEILAITSKTD